ncbi:MAG: DUF4347 domain-containing protein [Bacteroides sp.]|nr:DUF4347 domain-containing protein [Bacteroides sp.]
MKVSRLPLFIILLCFAAPLFSQSLEDLIIIDESADNYTGLQAEFANQANVYFTDGNTPDALRQITDQLVDLRIRDLHIYVPTKPGAIVFASIALTWESVDELPLELTDWTGVISGKVVIHSEVVFTGDEGQILKQELESKTGLAFVSQH